MSRLNTQYITVYYAIAFAFLFASCINSAENNGKTGLSKDSITYGKAPIEIIDNKTKAENKSSDFSALIFNSTNCLIDKSSLNDIIAFHKEIGIRKNEKSIKIEGSPIELIFGDEFQDQLKLFNFKDLKVISNFNTKKEQVKKDSMEYWFNFKIYEDDNQNIHILKNYEFLDEGVKYETTIGYEFRKLGNQLCLKRLTYAD